MTRWMRERWRGWCGPIGSYCIRSNTEGPRVRRDLVLLRARNALVRARTGLINSVRGLVKSMGARLPVCSAESFPKQEEAIPENLRAALMPLVEQVELLTARIR